MLFSSYKQLPVISFVLLWMTYCHLVKSLQFSDLKSKISGVEELLEEFRKQLQEEQALKAEDGVGDVCLSGFNVIEGHIIRAKDSIELGATFLTAPSPVYSWKACLHACCADPRCSVAVVQEDLKQSDDSLSCFLFNCTYRNKNVCTFSVQQGYNTYSRIRNASGFSTTTSSTGITRQKIQDSLTSDDANVEDTDEPPRSDAGQDVVIQLPTDWAVLDGRDSVDDHGITRYEWVLILGDPSVNMKVTQPGILKLSGLEEGSYIFQMTVTDTAGQRSSDNVTITVLPPKQQPEVCTGRCSRYQFACDDGCCIDITYACDGKQQCTDRSDEAFCQNFDGSRKAVSHTSSRTMLRPAVHHPEPNDVSMLGGARVAVQVPQSPVGSPDRSSPLPMSHTELDGRADPCSLPRDVGPCKGVFPRWYYDPLAGVCKHFLYGGCKGNTNNFLQEEDCLNECRPKPVATAKLVPSAVSAERRVKVVDLTKPHAVQGGHPGPESGVEARIVWLKPRAYYTILQRFPIVVQFTLHDLQEPKINSTQYTTSRRCGAILPLALGLVITALLLLMVGCRLRLVRHKLKKARPITSEESDYLINGMYL